MTVRRPTAVLGLLLVLVAGACSSTNEGREAEPLAAGASAAPGATAAPSGDPDATPSSATTGSGGGSAGAPAPTGGGSGGSGGGSAGAPALTGGPPVRVGVHYTADLGAILGAFGAQDSTDGPGEDVIRKVTAWINSNGGFGKRKVEVVLHGGDPVAGSFDAQAEEACVHFTEDDPVDFVISGAAGTTMTLLECLRKADVPLIWDLHVSINKATFDKYRGYLYQPFNLRTERQGIYIDELQRGGYFGSGAKIGFLRIDESQHLTYRNAVVVPRLKAHGLKILQEAVLPPAQSSSDAGALYAAIANAVLRFKQAGVTHVLFAPTGGGVPFLFLQEASNQDYEPRYGFNSLDIPAFVDLNAPDGQLDGALAVGWLLTSDALPPQRPTNNAAERLCLKITDNRSDIASRYCDGLFFLKRVFDAGADNTPASVLATVGKLGTSYTSPWTFQTDLAGGRPDGASAARLLRWGGQCECFEYIGPVRKVP